MLVSRSPGFYSLDSGTVLQSRWQRLQTSLVSPRLRNAALEERSTTFSLKIYKQHLCDLGYFIHKNLNAYSQILNWPGSSVLTLILFFRSGHFGEKPLEPFRLPADCWNPQVVPSLAFHFHLKLKPSTLQLSSQLQADSDIAAFHSLLTRGHPLPGEGPFLLPGRHREVTRR